MAQTKVKLISDGVIVQGNLHASHGITTAHIGEGSNLYYTDARVSSYLSTNGYATQTDIVAAITDSAPVTLDTLNELAAALGDDPNFATTTATSLGLKAPLASPSFTGNATFAGNVGIGVTPENWATVGNTKAIQISTRGALWEAYNGVFLTNNIYFDGANKYIISQAAARLNLSSTGELQFFNAPSGTADATVPLVERMRIDSSGNVGIGQTSIPSTVLLDLKEPDAGSDLIIGLTAGTGGRAQIRSIAQANNFSAELSFYTVTGNSTSERMRIDSLGALTVSTAASTIATFKATGSGQNEKQLIIDTGGNRVILDAQTTAGASTNLVFQEGGGNVGIGVTPFAHSLETSVSVDLLGNGGIWGYNYATYANSNAYYDSGWKYKSDGPAAVLQVGGTNPTLTFRQAGSGTAGNPITYTQSFTILGSGNVGIGDTSPDSTLSLQNSQSTAANNTTTGSIFQALSPNSGIFMRNRGASAGIGGSSYSTQLFTDSGAGNFEIYNISSTFDLVFGTNATERMRIESDGDVLLTEGNLTMSGNTPFIVLSNTAETESGITFVDSADASQSAKITYDSGDKILRFYNNAAAERISIDSIGRMGFNSGIETDTRHYFYSNNNTGAAAGVALNIKIKSTQYAGTHVQFKGSQGNGGTIGYSNLTASYNTTGSDERLKKNITNWSENILDKFKDIQPKEFHFNQQDDSEEKQKGYIAQNEVDKFPEAYPLLYDDVSKEDRHQFNPSGMVVYLMKAIQELKEEIELLKNK